MEVVGAVGLASSIVQILDFSGKILKYLYDVRNANKESERRYVQVQHIELVIKSIKKRIDEGEAVNWGATGKDGQSETWYRQLQELRGMLDGLTNSMKKMMIAVAPPADRVQSLKRRLVYHFRKKE
jgi:hypothetical protein